MALYKNKASQKLAVFAFDSTDGSAKTGDAANISAQISLDGAATAATNDAAPTELDATDAPGIYLFDLTQAETNADLIVVAPVSATSNILLRPVIVYTEPEERVAASVTAGVSLADDAITAAKFDESTAFPLTSADTGSTSVARTGADSDTLETLSDQIDGTATTTELNKVPKSDGTTVHNATAVAAIQSGLSTYAGGDTSGTTTLLSRLSATRAGYLDNLSAGAVATAAKLLAYFQLLFRKDAAIETDNATELTAINADGGSGAGNYSAQTDSVEALRDRGDAAWTTATGFSTLDAAGVRTAVGLSTANLDTQLGALPTAAENAAAVADIVIDATGAGLNLDDAIKQIRAVMCGVASRSDTDPITMAYKALDGTTTVLTLGVATTGASRTST